MISYCIVFFFFFKQKTAYEMRISDWSSDVCSSDLKTACDAFLGTRLEEMLRMHGATRLILAGCATDYCVDTTVRAALARGWRTTVPSDGHTTADRPHLSAAKIIEHHNELGRAPV